MDAFVTRKKRKSSPGVHSSGNNDNDDAQEESTDVKLAILSSLHPSIDQETLLDILLAHDGNVETTSQILKARLPRKSGTGNTVAAQSSLRSFTVNTASSIPLPPKRPKLLSKKGQTLHLYDPVDISEHTPCTIIHNFLPPEEADSLLRELLEESKSFEKITFKLFDNVVSSPHTSGFYVGSHKELQEQKYEYVYNGSRMTVRFPEVWSSQVLADKLLGRQDPNTAAGACQGARTGGCQLGDTGAHPHALQRQEAQVPVPWAVDSQRGICKLLQRAAGECRLGMLPSSRRTSISTP